MSTDAASGGATGAGALDASFDALLRRAAHVSLPSVLGGAGPLRIGSSLLGGRFVIERCIGEGGMGTVYKAYDAQRRGVVALKTLNRLDAANVYRLKNEFRSLADVSHPSLCRLYELFGDQNLWFFTMELIDGKRFDHVVRPRHSDGQRSLDEQRLRCALPQLFAGIEALHAAGKLHRDLKPSNVLITPEQRVVILDFGLAVDPEPGGVGQTLHDTEISGTPGYMAPEQAAGKAATTASDYYAIGVMLFEALTGVAPFAGSAREVLTTKQHQDAPPVGCAPSAADIGMLCARLLSRDPAARPSAAEVVAQAHEHTPSAATRSREVSERDLLVGRDTELATLRAAYDAMCAHDTQGSVAMFVSGESGVGKSALVDALLSQLMREGDAVVLAGRCYEREAVPYKAFDALIDALTRHLRRLPREEANALMPRDVFALARLFPVLDRVDAVAQAPKREIHEPKELQQRAFAAFVELLGRIGDRFPLVVHIDDLQWLDRDSAVFLGYLMAHPEPLPALLIVSHRSEGAHDNTLLQGIVAAARHNAQIDTRTLQLAPLSAQAAHALAQHLLIEEAQAHAATIARESQGSPFFIGELARQARTLGTTTRLSLHDAVLRNLGALGDGARALLEALAVAGRPLPAQLALDATGTSHETIDALLAERLLRSSGNASERTVECYHDRIRELISNGLDADALRRTHMGLAHALSTCATADPEHLALHCAGAGQAQLAAMHYAHAADQSFASLAFEHAARQYDQALTLGQHDADGQRSLHHRRARALTAAGRNRQAAEAYRQAAVGASAELALDHKRAAAQLLLTGGAADEGRALLREVLTAVGLSLPASRPGAVVSAVWQQARLKLRGHVLNDAPHGGVSAEMEARLSVMWTIVQGGLGTDPFLIIDMLARYARLALDVGSANHASRALVTQAFVLAAASPRTHAQTEPLITRALALAHTVDDPEALGRVMGLHGATLYLQGRFVECRRVLSEAIPWFEQRCPGVRFEVSANQFFELTAAWYVGEIAHVCAASKDPIDDALRRGDAYAALLIGAPITPALLAYQGIDVARQRLDQVTRLYRPQTTYEVLDLMVLLARLGFALYEGRPQDGVRLSQEHWPVLERTTPYLRSAMSQAALCYHRSACVLAALSEGDVRDRRAQLAIVKRDAATLRRNAMPYAHALADVLAAALALHDHQRPRAIQYLRAAIDGFAAQHMRLYVAATQRRLAALLTGGARTALQAESDAQMTAAAVVDAEAITRVLVAGCIVADD